MATQDGYVQVAPDSTGKLIDNAELTREPTTQGASGSTVYRQRVVISSDEDPTIQQRVAGEAGDAHAMVQDRKLDEVLGVLVEIRDMLRMVLGG